MHGEAQVPVAVKWACVKIESEQERERERERERESETQNDWGPFVVQTRILKKRQVPGVCKSSGYARPAAKQGRTASGKGHPFPPLAPRQQGGLEKFAKWIAVNCICASSSQLHSDCQGQPRIQFSTALPGPEIIGSVVSLEGRRA